MPKLNLKQLEKLFAKHGAISRHFKKYELRPAQVDLMKAVARALEKGEFLAIEAKPAIGKTLAYLISAIYFAKTSGQKVVISDHSYTHREEIISRDIPILEKIIPFEFKVATLLKRNQYLCPLRFEKFKKKKTFSDNEISFLVKILLWLPITTTGDISEIPLTFEEKEIFYSLRSEPLPGDFKCPHWSSDTCFFYRALKKAKVADLVIAGHDVLLSEIDFPKIAFLIIDQAHHLEESATKEFGYILSLKNFSRYLASSLVASGSQIKGLAKKLEDKITLFFGLLGIFIEQNVPESGERLEFHLTSEARSWPEWQRIKKSCDNLSSDYKEFKKNLEKKKFRKLRESLEELFSKLENFVQKPEGNFVYEIIILAEGKVLLKSSPIDVSGDLQSSIFRGKISVVLISPQLDENFKQKLGIKGWAEERFEPEFAWERQAMVIIPKDVTAPASYDYTSELAEAIEAFVRALEGRTLALFTSQAQVENIYKKITPALKVRKIEVLAQRISGRDIRIVEKFKKNPRSVILTSSNFFWKEIDIPGKNLSGVIITKLPFSYPGPLEKARQYSYVNGFSELIVPQALSKFKEGFSRLIRTKKDKGVVLILDSRIMSQSYGLEFLKALPKVTLKYCLKRDIGEIVKDFLKSEIRPRTSSRQARTVRGKNPKSETNSNI